MKSRLLIIGIITTLGSVSAFVIIDTYQSQLGWDKRTGGLDDMRYDLQFQRVLDHCQKKELAEGELVIYYGDTIPFYYYNTTHYIGTNSCQWHLLENHPDTNILCMPGIEKWVSSEAIRNSTHIYDKSTCQWYGIISSFGDPVYSVPFDSSDEELNGIDVNYVDFRNAEGEIICKGYTSGGGFFEYPECGPIDKFVIHVLAIVLPIVGIVCGFIIWRKRK